jgi:hypothetical protein
MAKKQISIDEMSAYVEKAVRRSEKLQRTLTKLVAQSDPSHPAAQYLKAVEQGLATLRDMSASKAPEIEIRKGEKKMRKRKAHNAKKTADVGDLADGSPAQTGVEPQKPARKTSRKLAAKPAA